MSGIKSGRGKIVGGGGGYLGRRTSSSSTFCWLSAINTSSRPRPDKFRSVSLITMSIKGFLGSSRVRVFRNDEIGFEGLGSIANIFISGGLEEAPMVGSGGWYNDFFYFFIGEGSFCGLAWGSS